VHVTSIASALSRALRWILQQKIIPRWALTNSIAD
jgi:hypothetical protein